MSRLLPGARSAFTLVELLAVILILAIASGLAAHGLVASSDAARLQASVASCRDLDARARQFSRTRGPVAMTISADGRTLRLHSIGSRKALALRDMPAGVVGRLDAGERSRRVLFDQLGHSVDYEVALIAGDRRIAWRVYGLTGYPKESSQ